jgi:hypothetical protein
LVSESVVVTDAPTAQVQVIGVLAESASAADLMSAIRTANVSVTGVQLFISIGGTLVWAVIDDSQNSNWQNVVDAQLPGWQAVANEHTPGWQNVDDAQSPGWQDVVNGQGPGWNDLPS